MVNSLPSRSVSPGHVVGDGTSTIAQLVDTLNQDPRRGIGHEKVLTRIEFDHQAERLMELDDIRRIPSFQRMKSSIFGQPETYPLVVPRLTLQTKFIRITDRWPNVQRAIGLDVAGVDFITPDVTRSYRGGWRCHLRS